MNSNFYSNLKKSIVAAAIFVMTTSTLFATVPSVKPSETNNAKTEDGVAGMMLGSDVVTTQFSIASALAGGVSKEEAFAKVRALASFLKGTWAERELNDAARRGDLETAFNLVFEIELTMSKNAKGEFGWAFRTGSAIEKIRIGSKARVIKLVTAGMAQMQNLVREGASYTSEEELGYLESLAKYASKNSLSDTEFGKIHSHAVGFQRIYFSY